MIGAILGDIIGSIYEFEPIKEKDFQLFWDFNEITDDGLLTMAVFSALEKSADNYDKLGITVAKELIKYFANYPMPMGGYGSMFSNWATESLKSYSVLPAYNSFGNGAAMRISPVAYYAKSLESCIDLARKVTEVTHNHPEGIKGAEAVAVTVYMALNGHNKSEIYEYITKNYYPLNETCNEIRKYYRFEGSCQKTVPQSIQAFLESASFEDAVRIAISLGGDADTMAAITGSIAEAYYGIPSSIEAKAFDHVDDKNKELVRRMLHLRNSVVKRYLESETSKYETDLIHYRTTGADMDGFPDKHQRYLSLKYKGIFYECSDNKFLNATDTSGNTKRMNQQEFMFFIDEIRHYLHNQFKHEILSVADFYDEMFLEISRNYWRE